MSRRRNFLKDFTWSVSGLLTLPTLSFDKSKYQETNPLHQPAVKDVMDSIKITEIKTYVLEFPNVTPLTWNAIKKSGGKKPKVTFLELHTNAGIKGVSIPKGPKSVVEKFAKKIKDLNLLHIEKVWDHMYYYDRKPVAKGIELHAIGSVDLAVWDIIGKALGLPVHRILGTYREEIPVYAAGGYYAEGKDIAALIAEMESYAKEGFKVVKMKIGWLDARKDAERVRAVCKALGKDVRVMIDANNAYKSAYEAIRFGRMVEDLDLYWFEEPVAPDDWRGNAEVREALDIPIVAGENEYTRWGARDLIENHSCDILNLDTIKAGGISEYRKIAALASAYHIPVAPHGYGHMNIHVVASIANALILETYPKKARDFNPALPQMPVKNGMVKAPTEPGLGMEIDETMIKKYRVG